MLTSYKSDTDAESLCRGLHELGFWVSLPHAIIEEAYRDKNIPDRYCTVALMAENRHLIKSKYTNIFTVSAGSFWFKVS